MNNNDDRKYIRKKYLLNLSVTFLLILIIVLVTIVINVGLEKINIENIDITKERLYSLSDETKGKIKNIENNIKIITYKMNNYPEIINFIKLYNKENNKITYENINDITKEMDLQEKFGLGNEIKEPVIIIESEKKNKIIFVKDMYEYNSYTYQQYDLTEEKITNGIMDVNLIERPNVYFLKNHTEKQRTYYLLKSYLENEANNVKDLDLLVEGKIPDNCDLLIITSIEEDILKYERDLIEDYINKSGNLMILQTPNIKKKKEFENFNYILDLYGARVDDGILIENDLNRMIYGYENIVIPNINFNSETTNKILKNGKFALINSGTLKFKNDILEKFKIKREDLILTSSTCKREKEETEVLNDNNKLVEKNAPIASLLIKPVENNKESKLILCANNLSFTDMIFELNKDGIEQPKTQILMIELYNNKDFLINSISYLTNRNDNITLRKDTGLATFVLSHKQNIVIKTILILLPLFVIIFGIIVGSIRRKK